MSIFGAFIPHIHTSICIAQEIFCSLAEEELQEILQNAQRRPNPTSQLKNKVMLEPKNM
jgi:predicted nucleic acid-binding Zn ribbon protein